MPTRSQNASQYKNAKAGSVVAAATTVFTLDVTDFNNVLLMAQGTYAAGLTLVWEVSLDGVTWTGVQAVRTDSGTAETSAAALPVNQTRAWDIYIGPFNWFRVRSTTWAAPSGACDIWAVATEHPVDPAIVATINGTVTTTAAGSNAHSSSTFGNPVPTGGQTKTTVDTTLLDGDTCAATFTTSRQLVVKQFGPAELDWQYNTQGLTTTTTAAAAKTAGAASVRNYVTGIQATNYGASDVRLLILDGSTTIWGKTIKAGASISEAFSTPLRGTAATALNYNFSAAGASIDLNIQGYQNF